MTETIKNINIDLLMSSFAKKGGNVGDTILGLPGKAAGYLIGGLCGAAAGIFRGIFKK